jgi:signal transduction histidine kinase
MESNDRSGLLLDLTNLLTVISALVESLRQRLPPDQPVDPDFIELTRTIDRALAVARRGTLPGRLRVVSRGAIDVDRFLERMMPRLTHMIGSRLHLEVRRGGPPGMVRANWEQLERILLNLILHASAAAPDGGRITLSTSAAEIAAVPAAPAGRRPRRYVRLSVHHNGRGISADLQRQIRDAPTARIGRGAPGLDNVAQTVRQVHGRLHVESGDGVGTSVHVDLPLR